MRAIGDCSADDWADEDWVCELGFSTMHWMAKLVFEPIYALKSLFGAEQDTARRADFLYRAGEYKKAAKLYQKFADKNIPYAFFRLGNCHDKLGNKNLSEENWIKAAEFGYSAAAQNLGNMYYAKNNFELAKKYYSQGATAGRADSMYRLALIAKKTGSESQMNHWLVKAAEKNHGRALYDIAYGMFLKNDFQRALVLAERAEKLNTEDAGALVYKISRAMKVNNVKPDSKNENSTRENIYGFKQSSDYVNQSQSTKKPPVPKPAPKFSVEAEAEKAAAEWMKYLGFNAKVGGSTNAADKGIDVWADGAVAQVKMHGKSIGSQMLHTFDSQANLHAPSRRKLFFSWNGFNNGAIEIADQLGIHLFHIYSHGDLKPVNRLAKDLWAKSGQ